MVNVFPLPVAPLQGSVLDHCSVLSLSLTLAECAFLCKASFSFTSVAESSFWCKASFLAQLLLRVRYDAKQQ